MSVHLTAGRYLGTPGRPLDVGAFRVVESKYDGGEELPLHAHERAHFCLVLAGGYTERVGAGEHERAPATLLWHPAGVEHAERHRAPGRHVMVEVAPELTRGAGGDALELGWRRSLWLAHRLWVELVSREELAVEALALELLGEALREEYPEERDAPAWLGRTDERLRAEFVEPPRVTELAEDVGVHPVHLSRTYRRFRGCSIADAVRALRVREALRRLPGGRSGLAEIASDVGFADQSHLTRSFRALVGTTPGRWRGLLAGLSATS